MFKVKIVYNYRHTLMYIYLSTFFRMCGIFVYGIVSPHITDDRMDTDFDILLSIDIDGEITIATENYINIIRHRDNIEWYSDSLEKLLYYLRQANVIASNADEESFMQLSACYKRNNIIVDYYISNMLLNNTVDLECTIDRCYDYLLEAKHIKKTYYSQYFKLYLEYLIYIMKRRLNDDDSYYAYKLINECTDLYCKYKIVQPNKVSPVIYLRARIEDELFDMKKVASDDYYRCINLNMNDYESTYRLGKYFKKEVCDNETALSYYWDAAINNPTYLKALYNIGNENQKKYNMNAAYRYYLRIIDNIEYREKYLIPEEIRIVIKTYRNIARISRDSFQNINMAENYYKLAISFFENIKNNELLKEIGSEFNINNEIVVRIISEKINITKIKKEYDLLKNMIY